MAEKIDDRLKVEVEKSTMKERSLKQTLEN